MELGSEIIKKQIGSGKGNVKTSAQRAAKASARGSAVVPVRNSVSRLQSDTYLRDPRNFLSPLQVEEIIEKKKELDQRVANINYMLLKSPTDMIITYFGEDGLKALKKVKIDARTVYEPTDTDTQCEETIGRVIEGETLCWMCEELLWPEGGEKDAQCEHKLAIAQAVFFLELYKLVNRERVDAHALARLEYGWAHALCNLTKNDRVLIKAESTGRGIRFVPDIAKIQQLARDIWNSPADYPGRDVLQKRFKSKYPGDTGKDNFITAFTAYTVRGLSDICSYLTEQENTDAFNLLLLVRIAAGARVAHGGAGAVLAGTSGTPGIRLSIGVPLPFKRTDFKDKMVDKICQIISAQPRPGEFNKLSRTNLNTAVATFNSDTMYAAYTCFMKNVFAAANEEEPVPFNTKVTKVKNILIEANKWFIKKIIEQLVLDPGQKAELIRVSQLTTVNNFTPQYTLAQSNSCPEVEVIEGKSIPAWAAGQKLSLPATSQIEEIDELDAGQIERGTDAIVTTAPALVDFLDKTVSGPARKLLPPAFWEAVLKGLPAGANSNVFAAAGVLSGLHAGAGMKLGGGARPKLRKSSRKLRIKRRKTIRKRSNK